MKTVSFDDEAYEILKGLKVGPDDSFSDVVKRRFGERQSLDASAGAWKDVPDERVERLRQETVEAFGSTTG